MITIHELAEYRMRQAGTLEEGQTTFSAADYYAAGLDILGGCEICSASIAAYNACPSRSGFWRCWNGCIGDDGYKTVEEADAAIFGAPA